MSTRASSPSPAPTPPGFVVVPPGLAKVVVTDTEIGDVRGDEGFYHYRQYSAVELAEQVGFEQAWHLLFHGHLPSAAELGVGDDDLGEARRDEDEAGGCRDG